MALDTGSPQLQPRLGLGSGKRQETAGRLWDLEPRSVSVLEAHLPPATPGSHSSRLEGPAAAKAPSPVQSTDGRPQAAGRRRLQWLASSHLARAVTRNLEQLVCLPLSLRLIYLLTRGGGGPLVKAVCTEIASMEGAPNGPALLPLASVGSQGIGLVHGPRGQAGAELSGRPEGCLGRRAAATVSAKHHGWREPGSGLS